MVKERLLKTQALLKGKCTKSYLQALNLGSKREKVAQRLSESYRERVSFVSSGTGGKAASVPVLSPSLHTAHRCHLSWVKYSPSMVLEKGMEKGILYTWEQTQKCQIAIFYQTK